MNNYKLTIIGVIKSENKVLDFFMNKMERVSKKKYHNFIKKK